MSIFSVSTPAFKELGRLRKGAPKTQGLHDLHTFRIDIRPDEPEALSRFLAAYNTSTPQAVNVRLAFNEIERVWTNFFMVYTIAGLLGKAGLLPGHDGWYWHYLRDNKTGELVVKEARTKTGDLMPFDPAIPVYSYRSKKGEDVAVYAKPEGRLSVMIPELKAVGYIVFLTHGWYDCMRIESQLQAIKELAERVGMSLPTVPLILSRRPEKVSVSIDNKKHMEERWIVNLDVRQDWGEAQFALLDKIQPGAMLPAPSALTLPSNVIGPDDEADEEPESEEQPEAPQPPVHQVNTPPANGARPYTPQQVAEKLTALAATAEKDGWAIKDGARNMLAVNLENCFTGDPASKDKRHTVLFWLFGHESVKDLTVGQVAAISKWLNTKPAPDGSGEWLVDAMSAREAQAIFTEATKAEGQAELPLGETPQQEELF